MSPSVLRVPSSSGSSGEDDRKRKRRLSNRESARRSRQRKQKHETDLIDEIASLKRTVTEGKQKFANLVQAHSALEDEKKLLGNEKVRLEEELGYLNQVIHNFGGQLWSSSELDLLDFRSRRCC